MQFIKFGWNCLVSICHQCAHGNHKGPALHFSYFCQEFSFSKILLRSANLVIPNSFSPPHATLYSCFQHLLFPKKFWPKALKRIFKSFFDVTKSKATRAKSDCCETNCLQFLLSENLKKEKKKTSTVGGGGYPLTIVGCRC